MNRDHGKSVVGMIGHTHPLALVAAVAGLAAMAPKGYEPADILAPGEGGLYPYQRDILAYIEPRGAARPALPEKKAKRKAQRRARQRTRRGK